MELWVAIVLILIAFIIDWRLGLAGCGIAILAGITGHIK